MMLINAFALLLLILIPGSAIYIISRPWLGAKVRVEEAVWLTAVSGIAIVGWIAIVLAEFERYSLPLLLLGVLMVTAVSLTLAHWRSSIPLRRQLTYATQGITADWSALALLLLLGMLLFLAPPPFEYIVGGRDHGVYVNTGIHIAKTGGIIVSDPELAAVPASARPVLLRPEVRPYQSGFPGPWSEGIRVTGLTIRDTANGIHLPHAFHYYPALIAVFYSFGGIPMALATTLVLSLLGALSVYLVARRLFNEPVALLTLFLLNLTVTQVWFSSYPTAEIGLQLFFWSGLLFTIIMLETESRPAAIMAGVCFGILHLLKLDTVLVPVALLAFFVVRGLRYRFTTVSWWLIGAYLLLSVQAVWHAYFIATIYFIDHLVRTLLPSFLAEPLLAASAGYPNPADSLTRLLAANGWMMALGVLALVATAAVLVGIRPFLSPFFNHITRHQRRYRITLITFLAVAFVAGFVFTYGDELSMFDPLVWSGFLSNLYLTRLGFGLGLIGLLLMLWRMETAVHRFFHLMIWANILPFFLVGAGTAPDHFWVIRRFIPIAFPTFMLATAVLLWQLTPRQKSRWWQAALPLLLLSALVWGLWQHTGPVRAARDYDGLTQQLATLSDSFPTSAVLLLESGTPAQVLDLPLWFIYDHTVFTIRPEVKNDPELATAVSFWQSQDRPVYWLAANGTAPPELPGWTAQLDHAATIATPLMETPQNRIPKTIGMYQVDFAIYRLLPAVGVQR